VIGFVLLISSLLGAVIFGLLLYSSVTILRRFASKKIPVEEKKGMARRLLIALTVVVVPLSLYAAITYWHSHTKNQADNNVTSCPVGEILAQSAATGKNFCVNENYQGTTD